jgi:hypothetical protein
MQPINNSDTAWLIVADYNQDNGKFYEDLIEDVLNPVTNDGCYDYEYNAHHLGPSNVGCCNNIESHVGHIPDVILNVTVGGGYGGVGGGFVISGNVVGGHPDYDPN